MSVLSVPEAHKPIYRLEAEVMKLPQVDMPIEHGHVAGLYARTMHIPAGTILTGAVHREACFMVIRQGLIAVTSDSGPKFLRAGDLLESPAGTKRAGLTVDDTVLTTFHANPTDVRDPLELWDLYTIQPAFQQVTA